MTRKLALVVLSMDVFWFAACRAVPDAPLAAAAARGDVARIRTLVGASGMVDQPDQNGITPLIWATRQGQLAAVRALVDAGADINGRDARPTIAWTVLMHAIHTNQPDAVHLLLESGANPNARNRELTPLVMAAGYGYTGMVQDLLRHGADPYARMSDGMTALAAAVGGAPDIDRFTVASCQTSTVKALLERAPDLTIDSGSIGGRWALRFARFGGCEEVVSLVRGRQEAGSGPRTGPADSRERR